MSAISLPRSAAMNALKAAAGDVSTALRRELLRFRVNKQQLDLMAWEYAAERWGMMAGCTVASITVTVYAVVHRFTNMYFSAIDHSSCTAAA